MNPRKDPYRYRMPTVKIHSLDVWCPLVGGELRDKRVRQVRPAGVNIRTLRRLTLLQETPRSLPTTRSECEKTERPCPFVSCRHHLYLDVSRAGGVKLNFPDLDPEEMQHSCSLDLAAKGGLVLHEVAAQLNITRERIRQIELEALQKLRVAIYAQRRKEQNP